MTESTIGKELQLIFSKLKGINRIFRNNNGTAYQGQTIQLRNGDILIKNPRVIRFGLGVGTGDYIGFVQKKITMADIGSTFLVFTNVEIKTKNGKLSTEQKNFDGFIKSNGGLSFVFNHLPEGGQVEKILSSFNGVKES